MFVRNSIICGDNVEVLKSFPDECVDLTVTSPPYDNLREYNGATWDFRGLSLELYRVTARGGVVVWIVGDATIGGSETGTSFRQALRFMEIGFRLHDTMIYEKSGTPYPASDKSTRYSQAFEYMFVFSKGKPKTHNLIKDKPNRWAGAQSFGVSSSRGKDGVLRKRGKIVVAESGYRTNIWRVRCGHGYSTKDEIAYKHPAIFPEALARDQIIAWSNEGDLVLDPFCGSGTTLKMAKVLRRDYIGIDICEEYCKIAEERLSTVAPGLFA